MQRWQHRRDDLADKSPGGVAINALLPEEKDAILELFNQWGERDRSHRRLAHRGSYLGWFFAAPATVRRVLNAADKHFQPLPRPTKGKRRPFPSWASYQPNQIWIYDI